MYGFHKHFGGAGFDESILCCLLFDRVSPSIITGEELAKANHFPGMTSNTSCDRNAKDNLRKMIDLEGNHIGLHMSYNIDDAAHIM